MCVCACRGRGLFFSGQLITSDLRRLCVDIHGACPAIPRAERPLCRRSLLSEVLPRHTPSDPEPMILYCAQSCTFGILLKNSGWPTCMKIDGDNFRFFKCDTCFFAISNRAICLVFFLSWIPAHPRTMSNQQPFSSTLNLPILPPPQIKRRNIFLLPFERRRTISQVECRETSRKFIVILRITCGHHRIKTLRTGFFLATYQHLA